MNAAMMMTGSGGWPLNVMLTPDLKPFFATTYIPNESREVVIVGEAEAEDTQGILAAILCWSFWAGDEQIQGDGTN